MINTPVNAIHNQDPLEGINWNTQPDPTDSDIWDRLTTNFWLPEKIPVSNDVTSWRNMTPAEQDATLKVFTGLTVLDTLQGTVGAVSLIPHAVTPQEEAIYTNIAFMESVHAKSYSNIFMTLASTPEIDQAFRWSRENEHMQYKARRILAEYASGSHERMMIASVMLESFLFYSGFYLPLRMASLGKITNSADIIRLIIRDECLTGDHELLTPAGWKPISEITTNDKVAQWHEDGTITFAHPERTSSHEAEQTYTFKSKQGHISQSVSPRHRMVLERRSYGTGTTDYKLEETLAQDLKQTKLNAYARFIHAGKLAGSERKLTTVERLLIAIAADGNFDTSTVNQNGEPRRDGSVSGHVPCTFTLSKPHKIERLQDLAKQAGWKLVHRGQRKAIGNVKAREQYTLYVPKEVSRDKTLASIASLDKVNSEWCADFIEEIGYWDGHIVKENPERITWGSVKEDDAKFVQAVAALAGYRTHYRKIEDSRSETFSDYHRVQINRGTAYSGAQHVEKTETGSQRVYGVQVPSTYLLTRKDGSVTVTGNSVHGYYIGYKFQQKLKNNKARHAELQEEIVELLLDLYDNESHFTETVYDQLGWAEDVKAFLRYNANKALNNLGYEAIFPQEECKFNAGVMTSLDPSANENHDFFSGSGSSYVIDRKSVV